MKTFIFIALLVAFATCEKYDTIDYSQIDTNVALTTYAPADLNSLMASSTNAG